MSRQPQVFISHQLEALADELKNNLFQSNYKLAPQIIVVPSHHIKLWLQKNFIDDPRIGIAMGMRFMGLMPAIEWVSKLSEEGGISFPSRVALALEIETVIQQARIANFEKEFAPLQKMIGDSPFIDRRIRHLADHLADAFLQYSRYGGKFLQSWSKGEGWQQSIWNRVMSRQGVLYDALMNLKFSKCDYGAQLHVFGLSFIPDLFFECFHRASATVSVNYYSVSPCQIFWGDAISDRYRLKLQENISAMHHPLLTNWGMIGKIFPKQIERYHYAVKENYPSSKPTTMLEELQSSILTGSTSRSSADQGICDSIQLHQVPSKLREVEVLKDALIDLAKTHGIQPDEVLVLAPSISTYAPYIQMVFSSDHCPFTASVSDETNFLNSPFLQGMVGLIELATGRFEKDEVLAFFNNPALALGSKINQEDLHLLAQIAQVGGVHWGLNSQHRHKQISMPGYSVEMIEKSNTGTWEFGFDGYLMGLAVLPDEHVSQDLLSLDVVDITQAESLGKWVELFKLLFKDLEPIMQKKTLSGHLWHQLLNRLAETYFDLNIDEKGYSQFRRALFEIDSSDGDFQFDSIWKRLKQELMSTTTQNPLHDLKAIQFCSMKTGRARPAKVIWCLGLHEGAYPRLANKNPCDELESNPLKDPYPTHAEEDRYLMLELLLSARHTLAFSYLNRCEEDGKVQGPSILIDELLATLPIEPKKIQHSMIPFDQIYFQPSGTFLSHNKEMYGIAKEIYSNKQVKKSHLIPQFFSRSTVTVQEEEVYEIDVKDLFRFAQHPLRYFFNRRLGIYLDRNEGHLDKEFEMRALDAFLIKKSLTSFPIEKAVEYHRRLGKGPLGIFGDVVWDKVSQEMQDNLKDVKIFGIEPSELYTIQMDRVNVKQFYMDNIRHILPAIPVDLSSGKRVYLKGKIDGLSDQGVVIIASDQFEQRVKIWPMALICAKLSQEHGLWPSTLLWAADGTKLELELESIDRSLRRYIEYFLAAEHDPSPLLPSLAESFLNLDFAQLHQMVIRALQSEDPYTKWAFSFDEHFDPKIIYDRWCHRCRDLLKEIRLE